MLYNILIVFNRIFEVNRSKEPTA